MARWNSGSVRMLRVATLAAILISIVPVRPAEGQAAGCFATPTPPPPTDLGVGVQPVFVAIGDLNLDGRPDLAIANQGGGVTGIVSIRLGTPFGTFDSAPNVAVGSAPRSVAIGDFNGDGKPDLAVGNASSNPSIVSIRLGVGDGTFTSAADVPAEGGPQAVVTADFDGDGNLDLAIAKIGSGGPSVVSIRLGDGNGGFGGTTDIPVGSAPLSMAVGDFNADGRPDLAVANIGSDTVSIRLGDGLGGFGPPPSGPADIPVGNGPQGVTVGDVNGDGKTDVVTANIQDGTVSILPGVGNGTFGAPVTIAGGALPIAVALGDFNGDARLDLAITNATTPGTVSIRLANGDGTFADPGSVGVGNSPIWAAVGDLNGDLVTDLAVANFSSNTVSVRLGNGNGTFGGTADVAVGTGPRSVAIGDLNGDVKADLAVANVSSNSVSIRLGNGNGTFAAAADVPIAGGPFSVAIGDLNGDGRLDLAVASVLTNNVAIRLGNGDGTFGNAPDIAVGDTPTMLAMGDLNGDGRPDLAITNYDDANVSIRLGAGNGTFTKPGTPEVAVGALPTSVAIGDLNGDGKADLAVANSGANTVSIRLGNGNGTFTNAPDIVASGGATPNWVEIGDFNGDGRPDLAATNGVANTVTIRLGLGDGTFAVAPDVSAGVIPTALAIGDLNGDGRLDLAIVNDGIDDPLNPEPGTVSIRLGNGSGTFAVVDELVVQVFPLSIELGQLNGDGRLDLAVGNILSNSVTVRLNSCGEDLVPRPRVPAAQTVPEDGTLTFSPANSNAITVTDDGRSATLHVTLTAASGTLTLGTAAGLRFSSGDGTADPTVTFSGTLAQVTAALTNLTFIPTPQYNGAAQIIVTVHDDGHSGTGSPSSGVATVPITVTPVDDAPTAADDAYATGAGAPLSVPVPGVLANDSDPDSAPSSLRAAVVTNPTHGTLALNADGGFTYAPNSGFAGTDTFTYQARDAASLSAPATVTITVGNAAPTAGNDTYTVAAGTPLTVAAPGLLGNDADADSTTLTVVKVTDPAHGSLTLREDGSFTYQPAAGFTGTDTFTYRVRDGITQSQPATATIVVTPANVPPQAVNASPTAVNDAYSTAAQTTLTVPAPGLLANDSDPDSPKLTTTKASEPTHGTLTVSEDGGFIYAPKPGFFGTDSFTYRAADGTGQSSVATVILTVTPTACGPRPSVQTNPVAGAGRLSVHLESTPLATGQNNALKQIQFGAPQNARVTLNGQPVTTSEPILLPPGTHALDFTVERVVAGQPTLVPFTVVDGCGEWKSFVGGGAAAGF